MSNIRKIVIVGGGTAGWLVANILAKKLNLRNSNRFSIQLVESPDIPSIGVGEGTVPTMRETLKLIEISETEFLQSCDVTFKQSIRFVNWMKTSGTQPHEYYHLFNYPKVPGFDLTPYWLDLQQKGYLNNYAANVSVQAKVCQHKKAPKKITTPEFRGLVDYAYHLDSVKFGKLLKKHAISHFGVDHTYANVQRAVLSSDGYIEELLNDAQPAIAGDFFVDCSGFSSLLLNQSLDVPFKDKSRELMVDTALAIQVPYTTPEQEIASSTIATAEKAGWIWDIGLTQRRGVGYVYSSNHTTEEEASICLSKYLGVNQAEYRKIPMKIGYREEFWKKNCVAIGLSAGFVEPLEATALLLVEASSKMLGDIFPASFEANHSASKRFNQIVEYAWDRVIDFIKLHYYLSDRDDSDFWIDNRNKEYLSQTLRDKLEFWKYRPPTEFDFPSRYEIFGLENYQYVLYGMGYQTVMEPELRDQILSDKSMQIFNNVKRDSDSILQLLPSHRELLDKIKQFGLHKN